MNRKIGLMVFPLRNRSEGFGKYFVDQILSFIVPHISHVVVITGNYDTNVESKNIEIVNIKIPAILMRNENIILKILRFLCEQLYLSIQVIKHRKKFDLMALHLGAPFLIFPTIVSYLMRKKIVIIPTGSNSQSIRCVYHGVTGKIYYGIVCFLERIIYFLSSNIVVFTESMIPALSIGKYKYKIISGVGNSRLGGSCAYIATDHFSNKHNFLDREEIIGYVGRLRAEKGIVEFVEAIPQIIKSKANAHFLIVGDGHLKSDLKLRLKKAGCLDKVEFTGVIPHSKISEIMNRIRFLIVPSYTEIVAAAALEGMACGAICLATPVGATKDIIIDGETGFLLDDNKPSTITNKLLTIWDYPELDKIQFNARKFIEHNFTQEKVSERWAIILDRLIK